MVGGGASWVLTTHLAARPDSVRINIRVYILAEYPSYIRADIRCLPKIDDP